VAPSRGVASKSVRRRKSRSDFRTTSEASRKLSTQLGEVREDNGPIVRFPDTLICRCRVVQKTDYLLLVGRSAMPDTEGWVSSRQKVRT
jgi:hypothetical protein